MTVRRTMLEMLRDLRVEIGMATDVNLQADVLDRHKAILQRVQRLLYDNETWPHLLAKFTVQIPRAAQSVALPDTLNPGAILNVYIKDTENTPSRPYRIAHGWSEEELVSSDPTALSWPIQRWQLEADPDLDEEEFARTITFWPYPDRDCEMYLYGRRAISQFVDDNDRSTLDSDLIVLQAAAELLASKQSPDAALKASAAQRRKEDLLARERGDVAGIGTAIR